MELCLLKGLYTAQCQSMAVGFQHDIFTPASVELKYPHERIDHVLHGIYIVVMEKDLVERYGGDVLFDS